MDQYSIIDQVSAIYTADVIKNSSISPENRTAGHQKLSAIPFDFLHNIVIDAIHTIPPTENIEKYIDVCDISNISKKRKQIKRLIHEINQSKKNSAILWMWNWLSMYLAICNVESCAHEVHDVWIEKAYKYLNECIIISVYRKNGIKMDIKSAVGALIDVEVRGQFDIIRAPGNEWIDELEKEI